MTNAWPTVILGLLVVLVALPIISYLVEALRPAPTTPAQLKWDSQIPIRYVEVDGIGPPGVETEFMVFLDPYHIRFSTRRRGVRLPAARLAKFLFS